MQFLPLPVSVWIRSQRFWIRSQHWHLLLESYADLWCRLDLLCQLDNHFFKVILQSLSVHLVSVGAMGDMCSLLGRRGSSEAGGTTVALLWRHTKAEPGRATSVPANQRPAIYPVPGMILFSGPARKGKDSVFALQAVLLWSCFAHQKLLDALNIIWMNSHPIGNVLEMANFPYTLIPHFVFAIFTHFSSTKATHLKIVRKGVPQQYLTADMPHAESSAVVKMRTNLNTLAVLKLSHQTTRNVFC